MTYTKTFLSSSLTLLAFALISCNQNNTNTNKAESGVSKAEDTSKYLSQPLVTHIYTAEPVSTCV